VLAIAGSSVVMGIRALRFWRSFKSFGGTVTQAISAVTENAAATEAHATAVSERTEHLTAAIARLQESLERLRILMAAANEVRDTVAGVRGVVPKK
jgi:hypothetical protein